MILIKLIRIRQIPIVSYPCIAFVLELISGKLAWKGIYPFLITYHLPEIFSPRTPILLGDTKFRRLEDGLQQLSIEKPLSKLHVEYWFHPYQLFDYTRLIEFWKWERNQNTPEKVKWNPFLSTPPIQTIVPFMYCLDYILLPFVIYPEYEQFVKNLDFVKETEKSRQTINSFIEEQTNKKIQILYNGWITI